MSLRNEYLIKLMDTVEARNAGDKQFLITVRSVLESIEPVVDAHPEYIKYGVLDMFVEPERVVTFRVPWIDDAGRVQVNRGYRVQSSSAIGPYKGGLRLHPSVTLDTVKFLAFEQTLKNSLTGLPIGGAKGGSDFDPKGKSDMEVMRFCQSFMNELYRHIGPDCDVPAGDIGVGAREIGYLYGQYKKLTGQYCGVLTGKGLSYGGSLDAQGGHRLRPVLFHAGNAQGEWPELRGQDAWSCPAAAMWPFTPARRRPSWAQRSWRCPTRTAMCTTPTASTWPPSSRSRRCAAAASANTSRPIPRAEYHEGCAGIWGVKCDIALPCATQNEIDLASAKKLVANGCICVSEGANMPSTMDAIDAFVGAGLMFGPAKAANAGGVATSALEMSQNSMRYSWTFEEVDAKLKQIMTGIYRNVADAAAEYGFKNNFEKAANVAGFMKVADAMLAQGVV